MTQTLVFDVFSRCVEAITSGQLITRESRRDKEYHFQDWFIRRLREIGENFDEAGRNTYPDFTLVDHIQRVMSLRHWLIRGEKPITTLTARCLPDFTMGARSFMSSGATQRERTTRTQWLIWSSATGTS